ncbi:MAG TPA: hypothetical protein VK629_03615 [Steroidobacteraceae bacterium]|nr:hypothetical protein [Steroidobacteraceae bacterium]
MDRTYIKSQRIVERYLSGDLTVREARDFEKFCRQNPDVLNTLPIPAGVKSKLAGGGVLGADGGGFDPTATDTSIDAAGLDDEDDDDEPKPSGFKGMPQEARKLALVLGAVALIAAAGAGVLWVKASNLEKQLQTTQRAAKAAQLRAPGSVQVYRTRPSSSKPTAATVSIGSPNPPELVDLHIDMSETRYNTFLVTIENVESGRVMEIQRVGRDSNKQLRLNINSSALSRGDYDVKLEGYTWKGDTYPVGWVRLGMK